MDKQSTSPNKTKHIENLTLNNRQLLKLDGIVEFLSSSENQVSVKLFDTNMNISGQNLHIAKLDIESGYAEISGEIECIKYGKIGNIFKRIFK